MICLHLYHFKKYMTFMVNLFLTDGICNKLRMNLEYESFCCTLLTSSILVSKMFIKSMSVSLGYGRWRG